MRILGISGSLRRASYNTALLRNASQLVPLSAEIEIYEGLGEIPLYNDDVRLADGEPEPASRLRQAIIGADALVIATPEYNWSVPGVLQNAIDWVSRPPSESPFRGKPVAIMGASGSMVGTLRAQLILRQVLRTLDAVAIPKPEVLVSFAPSKFDAEGNLTDETARGLMQALLQNLVSAARGLRD
jgi:chromate reductase